MATRQDSLARKQIYIPATKPEETASLRVAAYCRVSTDSDDQLNSFAAQHTHYQTMITLHEKWEMVEIYADEGITGTSAAKRPDFQRMLSDCRKGKIDKILVKSISRFARNTKECLEILRDLRSRGISVYFEEHNIDSNKVSSEMLTTVLAACAQEESISISDNTRIGIQYRMQRGEFNTCRAAIGFRLSPDGLDVQAEEAPVIDRIFSEYLQGMNSREIASGLNAEKALGRSWNRKLVDYILTNERYAGNALLQKKYRTETLPRQKKPNRGERPMYYVQNSNPAIVDQASFDQAAALRQSRKRVSEPTQPRFFAKRITCSCCGNLLRSKKVNGIWYWVCRGHEESASTCPLMPIPETAFMEAFLRLYYNLKNHQEILTFVLNQEQKIQYRQMLWSNDLVELNRRISDLYTQSHKLSMLNRRGLVDSDIFISKSNQLAEQLRKAKQQKDRLLDHEEKSMIESTEELLEVFRNAPEALERFDEELFCELIEKITVQSNTQIHFRLKNGVELPEKIERTVR